jgi:hypothetical protein
MIALYATTATARLMAERIGEVCFRIDGNDFCTVETDDMGTWVVVHTHDPLDMVKTLEEEGFL